jgi:hypothetical protein
MLDIENTSRMNKSILSTFLIIVLIFITACTESKESNHNAFAVKTAIDQILLANANGETIKLTQDGNQWLVNDQFVARQDMVDILLTTIKKVQVNYPVAKKEQKGIIKSIAAKHIKVELYNKGEKLKTYFVGDHTQDLMGTYFYLENDERPYVVLIPGFEGYLTPRYFTVEKDWRSRVIFENDPKDIKRISVDYDERIPNVESFVITQENKQIQITNSKTKLTQDLTESEIGLQYLGFFKHLEIEGFENDYPKKDSIIKSKPFCEIEIEQANGKITSADIYLMDLNQRSKTQFDRKGNQLQYDLDRMFVSFNEGRDFGILQMFVFGKLFQNYSSF